MKLMDCCRVQIDKVESSLRIGHDLLINPRDEGTNLLLKRARQLPLWPVVELSIIGMLHKIVPVVLVANDPFTHPFCSFATEYQICQKLMMAKTSSILHD